MALSGVTASSSLHSRPSPSTNRMQHRRLAGRVEISRTRAHKVRDPLSPSSNPYPCIGSLMIFFFINRACIRCCIRPALANASANDDFFFCE
jgi:hypothetical protein